jgi:hypothetical protein
MSNTKRRVVRVKRPVVIVKKKPVAAPTGPAT